MEGIAGRELPPPPGEREKKGPRIERERRSVAAMIRLYCRDRHGGGEAPCPECRDLLAYAWKRLGFCPHGEAKPPCAKCTIHCYRPDFREKIRDVMRHAGPRMLFAHPVIAAMHVVDGWRCTGSGSRKKDRDAG